MQHLSFNGSPIARLRSLRDAPLLLLPHRQDYPEAIHETLVAFLSGSSDKWDGGQMMKMTKTGATRA